VLSSLGEFQGDRLIVSCLDKVLPRNEFLDCQGIDDSARVLSEKPATRLVYVFLGESTDRAALAPMLSIVPRIPVIVELEADDPTRALELMRDGVFSVTTNNPPTKLYKLIDVFQDALSGASHQSWPPLTNLLQPENETMPCGPRMNGA